MNKTEIIRIIKKIGVRPSKRMGQNFALDEDFLKLMSKEAQITNNDEVLEIGGGIGTLSEKILESNPKKLYIYEYDKRLFKILLDRFKDRKNVVLLNEDYLKSKSPSYQVNVSNPPFSASSKIFLKVLQERPHVAILTFQKDFVNRLIARPGSSNYGRLSIISYFFVDIKIIKNVSRLSFFPSPKVDVSLVKIVPKNKTIEYSELQNLEYTLKDLFKYRLKIFRKAIKFSNIKNKEEITRNFQELMEKRVFQLTPEEFLSISKLSKF